MGSPLVSPRFRRSEKQKGGFYGTVAPPPFCRHTQTSRQGRRLVLAVSGHVFARPLPFLPLSREETPVSVVGPLPLNLSQEDQVWERDRYGMVRTMWWTGGMAMRAFRACSTSARTQTWALADGVVSFARRRPPPPREEAERLLEHGLAQVGGGKSGAPAAKILLEWQAMEAEKDTKRALEKAKEAVLAASQDEDREEDACEVRVASHEAVARLCTRLGMDAEAVESARQAVQEAEEISEDTPMLEWKENGVPTAWLRAYGALGSAHLAAGDVSSAMDACSICADVFPDPQEVEKCAPELSPKESSVACAFLDDLGRLHHVLSGLPESSGESDMEVWLQSHEAAEQCYKMCIKLLQTAKQKNEGTVELTGSLPALEVLEADAHCGLSQLYVCTQSWKEAESHAEMCLTAAERAGEDSHPRIGMALLQLGHIFYHTNRLTLGEGLYRKAGELLKDTAAHDFPNKVVVHPTTIALWNWRYSQLLSLMPKRGSEVAALKEEAIQLWKSATNLRCEDASVQGLLEEAMGGIGRSVDASSEEAGTKRSRMCKRSAVMILRMGRVIIPGHWPWANKL